MRPTAPIPNEQTLSGLRPIPHRALPSVPPLRPRFALLPRPLPGAGAVMAIARGKPCQGVVLAVVFREKGGERARTWFDPGISPCSGPWWLSPRGVGTGEGVSPPRAKCHPKVPLRQPPPRLRFALLPCPLPGAGAVMTISGGKPCPVLPWDLPGQWTVGISPSGEGTGEGAGAARGNIREKPSPGMQTPGQCEKDR